MELGAIRLVKPSIEYKDTFIAGLKEFQAEGLPWVMDINLEHLNQNFTAFVESELKKKTLWTKDKPVDQTELWAIADGVYVGRIAIRHRLNEDLKVMGGHIGYDTVPRFRGRGVASTMLKLALPVARDLGLNKALLTCNDDNVQSIRVIEKNGGVLGERILQSPLGPLKRYYWIAL